jgi:single-strand DNA-binding protein
MLNRTILMGRITHDLELRSTPSGTSVLQFSLAVERNFAKQGEERQTDFISCVAWKQTAEMIAKWFGKGRLIAIEGRLQSRSYEDKQGNKHTAIEVIVDQVSFTGEGKKDGGGQQTAPQDGYNDIDVLSDDEIPF